MMKRPLLLIASTLLASLSFVTSKEVIVLQKDADEETCAPLISTSLPRSEVLGSICIQQDATITNNGGEVSVNVHLAAKLLKQWGFVEVHMDVETRNGNNGTSTTSQIFPVADLNDTIIFDISNQMRVGVSATTVLKAQVRMRQQAMDEKEETWETLKCNEIEILLPPLHESAPEQQQQQQQQRRQLRGRRRQLQGGEEFQFIRPPVLPTCPPLPTSTRYSLSEEFFKQASDAFDLIDRIENDDVNIEAQILQGKTKYPVFNGWSDINDQAVVAKTNDTETCFAVFMGSQMLNPFDQWQNVYAFNERMAGTDCVVRGGYHQAYFTSYYEEFKEEIGACVRSCVGRRCPLVLSGLSQGGAIAVIASIDLRRWNPTVITFGAPRAIHDHGRKDERCLDANPSNHYRFVNLYDNEYDQIAAAEYEVAVFNIKHIGHMLLLDDDNFPIAGTFDDNFGRFPWSTAPHEQAIYGQRIRSIIDRNCFPVPVGKWPAGHQCSLNNECESGSSCVNNLCTPQVVVTSNSAARAKQDVFP